MPTNLKAFVADLFTSRRVLRERHSAFQKRVFFAIAEGTTIRTPVLSGKGRGGWRGSRGSVDDTDQPEDMVGNTVLSKARSFIESLPKDSLDTLFWSNPVEYMIFLEEGSSSQAPAGIVDITVAETAVRFNRVQE